MQQYLAFVDEIGRSSDGGYIYRFDFTENTDVVWGDHFNISPAIIVPNMQPEVNCLSMFSKAIFPREMVIAKKNSCFSMQDCIDGVVALMFSEIDDETLMVKDMPFILNFGEKIEDVEEKMKLCGITMFGTAELNTNGNDIIDNLINGDMLDDNNDDDNYDF